jgi:hypothetical protein|tara:strand:- start:901 stop:1374 length:474 start_codon:yes stop_codon:yes gene_type:complete
MATSAQYWGTDFSTSNGETNATYEFLSGRSPNRYHLMRILRKRNMREMGEIIATLLGDATPATSASVTITQVDAVADTTANVQGGVRGTTANEQMGLLYNSDKDDASANTARAVSAADVTALLTEVLPSGARANRAPATYAADSSGNGGGGKHDSGR